MLNTASIQVQEAGDELGHYQRQLDSSPERLTAIDARLTRLNDMARKHHSKPELLGEVLISIREKINELEQSETRLGELAMEQNRLLDSYKVKAKKLSRLRNQAAKKISEEITAYMPPLGMEGGEFSIRAEPQTAPISAGGDEKLTFYVKTNPGQAAQPLSKVVSGGELSRISLALQTIMAKKEDIPTFIFDEIDVGIGGKTAEMVGKLLRDLGKITQVYCITHLAQVAAKGEQHYRVIKSVTADETYTSIQQLDQQARIQELARMVSASKITAETLAHAEALLAD